MEKYIKEAVYLLEQLIAIPSLSGDEGKRADFLYKYLTDKGMTVLRIQNNLSSKIGNLSGQTHTLMLNSHIDTVLPSSGYTIDPYLPVIKDGKLFGLGSNDAGASVVSMIASSLYFKDHQQELPCNLMLLLSAEEENSGQNGVSAALKNITPPDSVIVGEPTGMKCAVAERGLLVIDAVAHGISGHAARSEGVNAIYKALDDINIIKSHKFTRVSDLMGEVKLTVTQISAGHQHNVVPDSCKYVIDIRPTEMYDNGELVEELRALVESELKPRNLSNRSSSTPVGHPLRLCAETLGIESYVSPTTSDWMRHKAPAIKMGPGDSSRSHRADEFIYLSEIEEGVKGYVNFIKNLKF